MEEEKTVRAVHVTVLGKVQGVGYRAWTGREARSRKLSGWVRNRRNGTVEAIFAGEPAVVEAMIAACRHGPPNARVNAVIVDERDEIPSGPFTVWSTL